MSDAEEWREIRADPEPSERRLMCFPCWFVLNGAHEGNKPAERSVMPMWDFCQICGAKSLSGIYEWLTEQELDGRRAAREQLVSTYRRENKW